MAKVAMASEDHAPAAVSPGDNVSSRNNQANAEPSRGKMAGRLAGPRGWQRISQKLKMMSLMNKYLSPATDRQKRQQRELEHRNIVEVFQTRAIATLQYPGQGSNQNDSSTHHREPWGGEGVKAENVVRNPTMCDRVQGIVKRMTVEHAISIILIFKMISVPFMWAFCK